MTTQFQVGDIVHLRSGTQPIEVTKIHKNQRLSGVYSSGYIQNHRPFKDFILIERPDQMNNANSNSALVSLLQGQRGMTTVKVRLSGSSQVYTYKKTPQIKIEALEEEETKISKQLAAAEAQTKLENLARVSGIDLSKISTPLLNSHEV